MNKFEGIYQHPSIVCKHQLDIKDIEKLAALMNLNIEIDDKNP
ncbi:hypothetical protein KU06112801_830008 [Flavobacterium psychrophilum]|nr:hypothetical protein [Flavobacterium psychrophilum]SNB20890.1 hypothetical protein KU06112801_830008 [Flavobacterium psychrophilum]